MGQTAKVTRKNRTITVDFHNEATYDQLLDDTKAFVEFVLAFLLALGFQLLHKASCSEDGSLTRHSHYPRVRNWFQDKKAGWYAVLADPRMPASSTLLDQAHNAIDRKLFSMQGFHHPGGSQAAFRTGLAHLYNLLPYQRRAKNAEQCGVEVEGGRLPAQDWMLNLQILTSGGFR